MKLGVFSLLDRYGRDARSLSSRRFEEALALARSADRLDYDTFWVGEHHFQPGGGLPAPPVLLAAAARETQGIRLGALVAALPLHSPRELAEQYALLDALSGGRLEIGVGSGYIPLEFQGFGLDASVRSATFERALPEFVAALRGDPLPVPGLPERAVSLNVRPLQVPTPPLWVAAVRREAVRAVGVRGLRLALVPFVGVDRIESITTLVEEYRAALPPHIVPRVLAAVHLYVGPNLRSATEALDRFLDSRIAPDGRPYRTARAAEPELCSSEGLIRRGLAILGTEQEVQDQLSRLASYGVTDVAGMFDFGGLPSIEVLASLERCATLVDPRTSRGRGPRIRPSLGNVPVATASAIP